MASLDNFYIQNNSSLQFIIKFSLDGELNEDGTIKNEESLTLDKALDQVDGLAMSWYAKYQKKNWSKIGSNLIKTYDKIYNLYFTAIHTIENFKNKYGRNNSLRAFEKKVKDFQNRWFFLEKNVAQSSNQTNLISLVQEIRESILP